MIDPLFDKALLSCANEIVNQERRRMARKKKYKAQEHVNRITTGIVWVLFLFFVWVLGRLYG